MDDVAGQRTTDHPGDQPRRLLEVLAEARQRGMVGPGDMGVMLDHARGFSEGVRPPGRLLDLGSGGGLPGLVLADAWPDAEVVLLDGSPKRVDFLDWAKSHLGYGDRVRAVAQRAEEAGRAAGLRGQFDMVVARGFGRPAVTAECGAPFLAVGGTMVVSEPPDGSGPDGTPPDSFTGDESAPLTQADRWPADGLAVLGLEVGRRRRQPYHYQEILAVRPCPERYPRRVGVPGKRPLF